jgi:Holliday junction resolvase
MNSRAKGARGERELASVLRNEGFDARRGQQYCGANGDADLLTPMTERWIILRPNAPYGKAHSTELYVA